MLTIQVLFSHFEIVPVTVRRILMVLCLQIKYAVQDGPKAKTGGLITIRRFFPHSPDQIKVIDKS